MSAIAGSCVCFGTMILASCGPICSGAYANILTALIAATEMTSLHGPPGWRVHQLQGDRAGAWSISVSGNWRITFEIEEGEIVNLELEDYH